MENYKLLKRRDEENWYIEIFLNQCEDLWLSYKDVQFTETYYIYISQSVPRKIVRDVRFRPCPFRDSTIKLFWRAFEIKKLNSKEYWKVSLRF